MRPLMFALVVLVVLLTVAWFGWDLDDRPVSWGQQQQGDVPVLYNSTATIAGFGTDATVAPLTCVGPCGTVALPGGP